jgi:hypothetical protein
MTLGCHGGALGILSVTKKTDLWSICCPLGIGQFFLFSACGSYLIHTKTGTRISQSKPESRRARNSNQGRTGASVHMHRAEVETQEKGNIGKKP